MCENCERASCSHVDIWSFIKHKSIAAIDISRENGGELLWLSWYCTHRMQPLNDALMRLLIDHFTREVTNRLKIVKDFTGRMCSGSILEVQIFFHLKL
jgi:hypothetical protein